MASREPMKTNWLAKEVYGNYRHCSNTHDIKEFCHPHTGKKYKLYIYLYTLNSLEPHGLNEELDLSSFL